MNEKLAFKLLEELSRKYDIYENKINPIEKKKKDMFESLLKLIEKSQQDFIYITEKDYNLMLNSKSDNLKANIYMLDSLITQIQLDLMNQEQQIQRLEAANLSLEKNSPLESRYLESIK